MDALVLLLTVGVAIGAVVQIVTDPRIDRPFIVKSLVALVGYAAHCTIGVLVAIPFATRDVVNREALAIAITSFVVLWIAAGALWLARIAPRLRPIPRVIGERFNWLDVAILTASGLALVAALTIG